MENSRTVTLSKRRSVNVYITLVFLFTFAFWLRVSPAFAVDEVEYFCNGTSGMTCDVFQLDGADTATPNANTCVDAENGCPSGEEGPIWPADWDALIFPGNFGVTTPFTANSNVGGGAGAGALYTYKLRHRRHRRRY